jgi:hypothetical protein
MSTLNPTKTSVKRMQQAINVMDIGLLLAVIDENKVLPEVNPVSKKPFLMEMISRHWWEGVHLYIKSKEDQQSFLRSLVDDKKRTVWHELAKVGDHWAPREFLDKYDIVLERDMFGRGPWWEWESVSWAKIWINKVSPSVWRKLWAERDSDGVHPIEYWLENKKWGLACWGWSHRPEISDHERMRWNEMINSAPPRWGATWRSWGV